MWAAYKRGHLPAIPTDLDKDTFLSEIALRISAAQFAGDVSLLFGQTHRDMIPIGLVTTDIFQGRAWPHVMWFPEASNRNKLECSLKYLIALKEEIPAMIVCRGEDVPFFRHINKYGVMRSVGTLRGYYEGEDGYLFETVG